MTSRFGTAPELPGNHGARDLDAGAHAISTIR
jgi:hypothetical protein